MVSVPARPLVLVFGAALNVTVPLPVPLLPDVIVSHVALLAAVHPHPEAVDTAIEVPAPPAALIDCATGSIEYEQPVAWFTVNVWPAIVSVPVRALPVFAATLNETLPSPVPLAPEVIVSHAALLVAVQLQPLVVDTATGDPPPPDALID